MIAATGRAAFAVGDYIVNLSAVVWSVVLLSLSPGTWKRTIRRSLSEQIVFSGVDTMPLVAFIAMVVGASVIVQLQIWVAAIGQTHLLGSLLVVVIVREVAPVVVNLVLIGRSGSSITTELATMKLTGDIRVLESQGIDPFLYLVLPRILGFMMSGFCLTVLFILTCLGTGFIAIRLFGAGAGDMLEFSDAIMGGLVPFDMLNLSAKGALVPLFIGAAVCDAGLSVRSPLDLRGASRRGLTRGVLLTFAASSLVSVLIYSF